MGLLRCFVCRLSRINRRLEHYWCTSKGATVGKEYRTMNVRHRRRIIKGWEWCDSVQALGRTVHRAPKRFVSATCARFLWWSRRSASLTLWGQCDSAHSRPRSFFFLRHRSRYTRKARSTPATMSKQRSTLSKGRNFNAKLVRHCCRFWQRCRTLLRHCCWCGCGPGLTATGFAKTNIVPLRSCRRAAENEPKAKQNDVHEDVTKDTTPTSLSPVAF